MRSKMQEGVGVIRVVVADDHAVVRGGTRFFLEKADDIEVVGEAADGDEALRLVQELDPDVLVLDMELPKISGDEVARRLDLEGQRTRVLALSAYVRESYIDEALQAGAKGYLTKDETPGQVVEAVRGVARGEGGWLSRRVTEKILARRLGRREGVGRQPRFTRREKEVLRLIGQGRENHEIANALCLEERTVKNYVSRIYGKLGVSRRSKAQAWAVEHGYYGREVPENMSHGAEA